MVELGEAVLIGLWLDFKRGGVVRVWSKVVAEGIGRSRWRRVVGVMS